jgi:hypothetical protein
MIDPHVRIPGRTASKHFFSFVEREVRASFLRVDDDGDRDEREDRRGAGDDIEVAVRRWIERTGINGMALW